MAYDNRAEYAPGDWRIQRIATRPDILDWKEPAAQNSTPFFGKKKCVPMCPLCKDVELEVLVSTSCDGESCTILTCPKCKRMSVEQNMTAKRAKERAEELYKKLEVDEPGGDC
jgi:hypothetical protein